MLGADMSETPLNGSSKPAGLLTSLLVAFLCSVGKGCKLSMEILAGLDVLVLSLSCMLLGTWRKEVLISAGEKAQRPFPSFFLSMAEGAAVAQGLGSTDSWAPCGLGEPLDPGGPVPSIGSLLLAVLQMKGLPCLALEGLNVCSLWSFRA